MGSGYKEEHIKLFNWCRLF